MMLQSYICCCCFRKDCPIDLHRAIYGLEKETHPSIKLDNPYEVECLRLLYKYYNFHQEQ